MKPFHKNCSAFRLVPLFLYAATISGCTYDEAESIHVQTRSIDRATSPVADIAVFVHSREGELLESGRTDGEGNYETAAYDRPVNITTNKDRSLQTVAEAAPGTTHTFYNSAVKREIGLMRIEIVPPPGVPAPVTYAIRSGPGCLRYPQATTTPIDMKIFDTCLDSEGRLTLFIEALGIQNALLANTAAFDLTPPALGQSSSIRIDSWNTPAPKRTRMTVSGAPATTTAGSFSYRVLRKGQVFPVGATQVDFRKSPDFPATFDVAAGLSSPWNGVAAFVDLWYRYDVDQETRRAQIYQMLPELPGPDFPFNISDIAPQGSLNATIDMPKTGAVAPRVTWDLESRTPFDVVTMRHYWNVQGFVWSWAVSAPTDLDAVRLPTIPEVFTPPALSTDVLFDSYVSATDYSWTDSYEEVTSLALVDWAEYNEPLDSSQARVAPGNFIRTLHGNGTLIQE